MSPAREAESLNHRIRNAAAREGVPPIRLRNRVAFQRLLARLTLDDAWVLKGGFSLEVRLGLRARATKDIDLLRRGSAPANALDLQDHLDEALDIDLDDGFRFRVRMPSPVRIEEAEPSTWRVVIDATYTGEDFGTVATDVVPRSASADDRREPLMIVPDIIGIPFEIAALDLHRHAAEKFHAFARVYAYERPSSRVKDLVDLVLLDESGLLRDSRLNDELRSVFRERDTDLPMQLPDAPGDWRSGYAELAGAAGTDVTDLDDAQRIASALYHRARAQKGNAS